MLRPNNDFHCFNTDYACTRIGRVSELEVEGRFDERLRRYAENTPIKRTTPARDPNTIPIIVEVARPFFLSSGFSFKEFAAI
jgi:hypothetical protein